MNNGIYFLGNVPEDCEETQYKQVAVAVLSCFITEPQLVKYFLSGHFLVDKCFPHFAKRHFSEGNNL